MISSIKLSNSACLRGLPSEAWTASAKSSRGKAHAMQDGGALHEGADQIVSNNVKQEFLFNHEWG